MNNFRQTHTWSFGNTSFPRYLSDREAPAKALSVWKKEKKQNGKVPTSPRIETKPNVFVVPTLSDYNECHAKPRFYGRPPFWTFRQTKDGSIWHSVLPWTAATLLHLKANTEEIPKSIFLASILLPLAKDSTMPSFAPHFVVVVCQLLNGGRADCKAIFLVDCGLHLIQKA